MTTDEWVTTALADDAVVAELLLRMKQSSDSSASQHLKPPPAWGHRQRRSKPQATTSRKERESMRFSPTTPLSWSSGGGASDGSDESCRPSDRSSVSRSKLSDRLIRCRGWLSFSILGIGVSFPLLA
ncbi:hypothetical protein Acr_00g0080850 [Actinidia rufa]|uniref:Uncharacterized protein n=1 Tax=Actinidia rufa TaxID=165716 RepID=A0A7J0DUJ3_9ERIC|nr:hypothetical protein Acr_00g0080850 [Actinidia rufa]